jgi:uncharacterized protein YhbP (UPF0306 family)
MKIKELANNYLSTVKHMQLATVSNGIPWICTVYFVSDDKFNLYWTSGRSRQHSMEILKNPKTAATVVKDAERKQALQMVGESYEAPDDELEHVHKLYEGKFGSKKYDLEEMKKHTKDGRSYWVFRPTKIMFWDEVNFPDYPKKELSF